MAEVTTLMCDAKVRGQQCQQAPIRYIIQVGPDTYQVDLCNVHAKHVLHAVELGTPVEPSRANTAGRKGRSRIRSVD